MHIYTGPAGPKFRFEYYSPRPKYWSWDGLPFGGSLSLSLSLSAWFAVHRYLVCVHTHANACVCSARHCNGGPKRGIQQSIPLV